MSWRLIGTILWAVSSGATTCRHCEPDTFCFVDVQSQCPPFSSAPAGSGTVADCICFAGFYRVGTLCVVCEADHYCPGGVAQLRLACPEHSNSVGAAITADMCMCASGHEGTQCAEPPCACRACAAGHYKNESGNRECSPCAAGAFSLSATECAPCPPLTQSLGGSDSLLACVAAPGAYRSDMPGEPATACPAGTYQDRQNQTSCQLCPAHTYQDATGAASLQSCSVCPPHAAVLDGPGTASSDCACDAGFFESGPAATCADDPAYTHDFYSGLVGCPALYYRLPGPFDWTQSYLYGARLNNCVDDGACAACCQTCWPECHPGEPGPPAPPAVASAGGTDAGVACTACAAGSFKSSAGSGQCQTCPADTHAAAGARECVACPGNSSAAAGSGDAGACLCAPGFGASESACAPCAPGSAKAAFGNVACQSCVAGTVAPHGGMQQCATCPANTFAPLGSALCQPCAASQSSPAASETADACRCVAGFFSPTPGSACQQCALGTYRDDTQECLACPAGTTTANKGATSPNECVLCHAGFFVIDAGDREGECVLCGANSHSTPGSVGACSCNAGFTQEDGAGFWSLSCVACAFGSYKTMPGNVACTPCPAGTSGSDAETRITKWLSCTDCPANTHWVLSEAVATCPPCPNNSQSAPASVNASDCLCSAGYVAEHDACRPCAAGTYKDSASNSAACAPCNGNVFSPFPAAAVCLPCPANSSGALSNAADLDCKCDAGFSGPDGGPCIACQIGKYKSGAGAHTCADCGPAAFWPLGATPSENHCQACPPHSSRAQELSAGVLDCVCDAGFRRTNATTCSLCPASHYCVAQHQQLHCPAHSSSAAGSFALAHCRCVPGFHGAAGNCTACPANAFCPANAGAPTPCPGNATTLGQPARTNVSACVCRAGFYRELDSCRECERDRFCFNDRMLACPLNSSAPIGADSVLDCTCDPGFRPQVSSAADAVCLPCHARQICRDNLVTTCAAGALNRNFRCVCDPGSSCPGATAPHNASCAAPTTCAACPHNHWCAENARTSCAANEFAPPNSSAPGHCRCLDGFYRDHLGACLECPLHHVCRNETRRPVAEFDPGLRTLSTRTVFLEQAVCALGMLRTAKSDVCKPCPVNFYCPSEAALALPNSVRCPENEFTLRPGASSRQDCFCQAGFKLSTHEATVKCLPCPKGQRCQGGQVQEEECHLQNKAISADHGKCECAAGFGFVNFECKQCPAGTVKPAAGDTPCGACGIGRYAVNATTCLQCPANADARPGSSQCICAAPYVWSAQRTCVLCAPDHYWTPTACAPCPAASTSTPAPSMKLGSDACRCSAGHHAAPRNVSGRIQCQPCDAGHHEDSGVCRACPPGAWAPAQSMSLQDCVCNLQSNTTCHTQRVDSSCAGACATTPAACAACAPGHHKPAPSAPGNTAPCLACAEGHYQPAAAASHCLTCPAREWHTVLAAADRNACLCVAGFTRPASTSSTNASAPKGPCAHCLAGHYKDWLGEEACAPCAVGRYNPHVNATVCQICTAATASAQTLQSALAAEAAVSNATVLDSTTTVHQAAVSVLACVCEVGQEPHAGAGLPSCRPCAPGSFKEHKDHAHCAYCGAPSPDHGHSLLHHFGAPEGGASNRSHCQACPVFSGQAPQAVGPGLLALDALTDCKCFPGHENRSVLACRPCPLFMQQTLFSDAACALCAAGHFFVDRHVACGLCDLPEDGGARHVGLVLNLHDHGLPWGTSGDDCVCRLGFQRNAVGCEACAAGKFRGSNRTRHCAECAPDTFQNASAQLQCLACPHNSSTLNQTRRTALAHCVCGPGFRPLALETCLPCAAGTYRTRRLAAEAAEACVACPADHFCPAGAVLPTACPAGELSLAASGHIDDCQCPPGAGRDAGITHAHPAPAPLTNPCRACARGFFAPARSNAPCRQCARHKNTSAVAATLEGNCTCVPGHGIAQLANASAPCEPCADGFFAVGARNQPCTHCGWGSVSDPDAAAVSSSACQCNAQIGVSAL